MAKALVLGATGHIGAHVVRALLAEGHSVRAAYRNEKYLSVLDGLPIEKVRVDLNTGEGLPSSLDGCEWVFHCAGYYPSFTGKREEAVRAGIAAARFFFDAVRCFPVKRIVFTSSAATVRRIPDGASTEEDAEPWPLPYRRPLYATVKIAMEHEAVKAAKEGLPIVIVNPTLCIGEYDAHAFSGRAVLAFAKKWFPFYIRYQFNAVYTGDVGIGHVRAAQRGRVAETYLLACRNIHLRDFAALAAAAAGVKPCEWELPYHVAFTAACLSEAAAWAMGKEPLLSREFVRSGRAGYRIDGSKAVREFGMPQTPVEEAVKRAVAWFKENGYLKK